MLLTLERELVAIKYKYEISALHSLLHSKVGGHILWGDVLSGQIVDRHVDIQIVAVEKPGEDKLNIRKEGKKYALVSFKKNIKVDLLSSTEVMGRNDGARNCGKKKKNLKLAVCHYCPLLALHLGL